MSVVLYTIIYLIKCIFIIYAVVGFIILHRNNKSEKTAVNLLHLLRQYRNNL